MVRTVGFERWDVPLFGSFQQNKQFQYSLYYVWIGGRTPTGSSICRSRCGLLRKGYFYFLKCIPRFDQHFVLLFDYQLIPCMILLGLLDGGEVLSILSL